MKKVLKVVLIVIGLAIVGIPVLIFLAGVIAGLLGK